ncbi:MAG: hypothetical protein CL908_26515 [Deltaproteobacteria bacterium]|jgi:prepilin-type N-terminal cleavage/methylation domain-containing protein|nr:hypothetical protein [Deltaproteobacteria bacterium]
MNRELGIFRDRRGLTLLEVLAAAMIFAMVMAVLVSSSSMSVRRSGLSARRLEANLVAESFLADLEIQIKQRIAPEVEEEERTQEDFVVRIVRSDFAPPPEAGAAPPSLSLAGEADIAALLGAELPEVARHLKRYDIEVSWIGGTGTVDKVTRTTFAFDWQAAASELEELFQGGAAGASGLDLEDPETLDLPDSEVSR